jgi:hypothetical protein
MTCIPPWFEKLTTSESWDATYHPPPRFFVSLRMTESEGLRMTGKEEWFDKLTTSGT